VKIRNIGQLEKADHGRVIGVLDTLLPYIGLWQDFHLGALNRILPLHVWEVSDVLTRIESESESFAGAVDLPLPDA
jgi:hypothetical protein